MEKTADKGEVEDDYPGLFKFSRKFRTFLSQPLRYFIVLLSLQLGIVIYFTATISQSSLALTVITTICYILTTFLNVIFPFVDPGIIPKLPLKNFIEEIPINSHQYAKERRDGIFMSKECVQVIKTHTLTTKFCGNCSIFRPPRTIHCYTCGACIEKLDHHCPWLGMCIAKRNYSKYLLYIIFMEATTTLIAVQTYIYAVNQTFKANQTAFIFNIILLVVSTLASIFVFTLIAFHFKLSRENVTTNEYYHEKWVANSGNPYQKSFFVKNWMKLFQMSYQTKEAFQDEHFSKIAKDNVSQSTKIFKPSTLQQFQNEKKQLQPKQKNGIDAITSMNAQQSISKPASVQKNEYPPKQHQ